MSMFSVYASDAYHRAMEAGPAGVNGGPCVSGVAQCPCCGDDTMVRDWRTPELCELCYGGECSPDGAGECSRLDGYPSDSYGATQDARPQYDGWTPSDFED